MSVLFIQTQIRKFYRLKQIHLLYRKITNAHNINTDLEIIKYVTASKYLISEAAARIIGTSSVQMQWHIV